VKYFSAKELPVASGTNARWPWTFDDTTAALAEGDLRVWPRITMVSPSYNQAQYLEQTIRSVLLQGYPNLEYIVLDGGSTDGSVEIIKKYSAFIDHWESQRDGGQSQAINKGLKQASGEILGWINSDDYLAPGALAKVATTFAQDQSVRWCIGNAWLFNNDDPPHQSRPAHPLSHDELMHWSKNWFAQQATFWSKSLIEQTGYLDESLHYLMDWELWLRFNAITPPAITSETLASYRFHDAAKCVADVGSQTRNMIREELRIHHRIHSDDAQSLACYKEASVRRLLSLLDEFIAIPPNSLDHFSGWEIVNSLANRVTRRVGAGKR
jgi:glycosyltransferase involved in cell wall biosynthesis